MEIITIKLKPYKKPHWKGKALYYNYNENGYDYEFDIIEKAVMPAYGKDGWIPFLLSVATYPTISFIYDILPKEYIERDYMKLKPNLLKGFFSEFFKSHFGPENIYDRDYFSLHVRGIPPLYESIIMIKTIPESSLKKILRFYSDLPHYRGMPDLFAVNINLNAYKFIEVKGPGDRLSKWQREWIDFFETEDIPFELRKVEIDKNPPNILEVKSSVNEEELEKVRLWNRDMALIEKINKILGRKAEKSYWAKEKNPKAIIRAVEPYIEAMLEAGKKMHKEHTGQLQLGYWMNALTANYTKLKNWKKAKLWIERFFSLDKHYLDRLPLSDLIKIVKRLERCKKMMRK